MASVLSPQVKSTRGTPALPELEPPGADDPDRGPDWRFQRALYLRGRRHLNLKREDPWVRIARDFLKLVNLPKRESLTKAKAKYPGLYTAWRLQDPTRPDREEGWTIEAYLCSGLSLPELARRTGLTIDAAVAYTKVFFDIEGRRDQVAWMAHKAIQAHGILRKDVGTHWKALGFLVGPNFLDSLFATGPYPQTVATGVYAEDAARLAKEALVTKAMLAARQFTVNGNERSILELWSKFEAAMTAAGQGGIAAGSDAANVRAVIESFNFGLRAGSSQQSALSAAEPRAVELLPGAPVPDANGHQHTTWAYPTPGEN